MFDYVEWQSSGKYDIRKFFARNDSFSPSSMLSIEVVQMMYKWHKNKKLGDDEFIDTFKEAGFPPENMLPTPTEAAEAHDHASLAEA
ncbi:hypothetical protein E4U35_001326 [Claviceps purpurea]|nr:hypothetical protein E4U35_001326 [Claviceps purpurea]